MKIRIIILAALCLTAGVANGQDKGVRAKLTEATVYFSGAELVHTATATLEKGENEVVIKGLSPRVDINSLKIKAGNNAVVSASEFSVDYLIPENERLTASAKKMKDSISYYVAIFERINVDLDVNNNMSEYLKTGIAKNVSGSETGLGIDELVKTMDYFRSKSEELQLEKIKLNNERKKVSENLNRLRSQYNQEATKGEKTAGVLKLRLSSPLAGRTDFIIAYFTSQAGWTPYYDVTIESTDKPVKFVLKSKVSQTTGLDWDKVKLSLSTAQPSNGRVAPLFSAWFLKQWTPSQASVSTALEGRVSGIAAQNSLSYDRGDRQLDEVVVTGYGTKIRGAGSVASTVEPMYVINGVVASKADFESLDPDMIKSVSVLKDNEASAIYGSRASGGVILVDVKGMGDYVESKENELNVVYSIDLPYTIPGNGREQNVELQTRTTPAEYKYYCAPKLDPQTFLIAEISDWENLGLMSATANVTYESTFIGQTYINASSTGQKLNLTLGNDKRVAVKRETFKEYSATRAIGGDTQQTFAYKLTVRNNQSKPVKMILKDQYPISAQKNIEVTLDTKHTTPWSMNREDLGVITWEKELAAGQSEEYIISYTVKYPKGMIINF